MKRSLKTVSDETNFINNLLLQTPQNKENRKPILKVNNFFNMTGILKEQKQNK